MFYKLLFYRSQRTINMFTILIKKLEKINTHIRITQNNNNKQIDQLVENNNKLYVQLAQNRHIIDKINNIIN